MKRRTALFAVVGAGIMISSASIALAGATPAPAPKIVKTSTLPAVGLSDFQQGLFPGVTYAPDPVPPAGAQADRGVDLGGIGSDLFRAPNASGTGFWMITDRGPNGELDSGERTFPAPWFDPTILHVKAAGSELKVLSATPVVGGPSCGTPVGGLPNLGAPVLSPADGKPYDDPPFAYDGIGSLAYAPGGLDTEGLVRTANGEFWFVEEYSPSLGRLDSSGCVQERYVPNGLPLTGAGYPIVNDATSIPALYQLRKRNRGFEALGLSPSGRYLFIGLQSPLLNPTTSAGNASLNTRILRYDLEEEAFDHEYVYRFQAETEYEPGARPRDLKVSAFVALDDDTLLVEERTDIVAKVFLVELSGATDILGDWDCVGAAKTFLGGVSVPVCTGVTTGTKSVEQMSALDLVANAIAPVGKSRLVVELDSRLGLPEKIEGIAVINEDQLAVSNDNDFNVQAGGANVAFDAATGNMILRSPAVPSRILRIKLAEPLPIDW